MLKLNKSKLFKSVSLATMIALGSMTNLVADEMVKAPYSVAQDSTRAVDTEALQKFLDFFQKLGIQDITTDISGEILNHVDTTLPADAYLGALSGIFDTITGGIESAIEGHVKFDPATIPLRIKNAVVLTKMIIKAATPYQLVIDEEGRLVERIAVPGSLYMKPQKILTQFGFLTSGIILDAFNPLTTSGTLEANLERIMVIYSAAAQAKDISGSDIANSNVRQELGNTLIKARWSITHNAIRWGDSSYLFEDLKNQVNAALPVRLGTKETVDEVTSMRNDIAMLHQDFEDEIVENAKYIRAQAGDREKLAKLLRKYRWYAITELKHKAPQALAQFKDVLKKATAERLRFDASIADINNEIAKVKAAYAKIKETGVSAKAQELRDQIVKLQLEARKLSREADFLTKMRLKRAVKSAAKVLKNNRHSVEKLNKAIANLNKAIASV